MNFYDDINNLIAAFKKTNEYTEYMSLKNELKNSPETYNMLKDFKDKQAELQMAYINGQEPSKESQEEMEKLYSIIAQNSECRKLLECEMKINVILADLQRFIEGENLIYSGNVNDCPEEIKQRETKNMTIGHKRIKIELK